MAPPAATSPPKPPKPPKVRRPQPLPGSRWQMRPSAKTHVQRLVLMGLLAILGLTIYEVLPARFFGSDQLLDTSRSEIILYRNFRNPLMGPHRRLLADYHVGKVSILPPSATWKTLAGKLQPPLNPELNKHFLDFPLAFAGTLTPANGPSRLVLIRLEIANTGDGTLNPSPEFWARTLVLDVNDPERPVVVHEATTVLGPLQYCQVHAGQVNPAKPDRCTLLIEGGRVLGNSKVSSSLAVHFILHPDGTIQTEPSGIPWKI